MGGTNSSPNRAVTIDNTSSTGVINVSEDVVNRLKDEAKAKAPTENRVPISSCPKPAKKQNEAETRDKSWYWKTKIQEQHIFEVEFNKSIIDVEKHFSNGPKDNPQLPPNYQDVKQDLIKCYSDHLNLYETLKCSQHILNFNACVNSSANI